MDLRILPGLYDCCFDPISREFLLEFSIGLNIPKSWTLCGKIPYVDLICNLMIYQFDKIFGRNDQQAPEVLSLIAHIFSDPFESFIFPIWWDLGFVVTISKHLMYPDVLSLIKLCCLKLSLTTSNCQAQS